MSGVAVLDANLTVLLVVGSASKNYIARHKRLDSDYTADDFDLLGLLVAQFAEIVLLPHVLAEACNIACQIANPARARILDAFRTLISTVPELAIPSIDGVRRIEFDKLGLTDSVLLHLCGMRMEGLSPTLITVDTDLANAAHALGYSVIDYKAEYQTG